MQLLSHKAYCPYCGEPIELSIDDSIDEQHYVEDCFVCCRPITISVHINEFSGDVEINVSTENDVADY